MKRWKLNMLLSLIGIPLLFWKVPIGLGWIVGQTVMTLLVVAREAFYSKLLTDDKFTMQQYYMYVLFTMILIAGPLLLSFFFQEILEPFAIFASYFLDRMLTFVLNLFGKASDSNAN